MRTIWRLTAFVSIAAVALLAAASAGAVGSQPTFTCTKVKQNGKTDVQVNVPEAAVGGLTNAGFTCGVNSSEEGSEPSVDEAADNDPSVDEHEQGQQPERSDEGSSNEEQGSTDDGLGASPAPASSEMRQESRSLYCSTSAVELPTGGGVGVALDLTDSQGALLVEMGLAAPAMFYEGLGASCDVLPGYEYAGVWVDHVGGVIPGIAVYPLYVLR
jgi:hypothetical protein